MKQYLKTFLMSSVHKLSPNSLELNGEKLNVPSIFEKALSEAKKLDFVRLANGVKVVDKIYRVYTINDLIPKLKGNVYSIGKKNKVFYFNNEFWQEATHQELDDFLQLYSEKCGVSFTIYKDFKYREALYNQFTSEVREKVEVINYDVVNLNLKNGTLKVENGVSKLGSFDRSDYLHYQLPFDYDPKAECPMWLKFLNQSIPETEQQMMLSEYLGTVFLRNQATVNKSEKILALKGEGSNGKGVIMEVLIGVFGKENVTTFSLESLTSNDQTRARIENKLLNISGETKTHIKNDAILKTMASGEGLEARLLYENPRVINDYAKIIVNLNKDITGGDGTHSFFRRFMYFPMENTVAEEDKDKMLAKKIIASESAGVLNWILEGLKRYMEAEGMFTNSEAVDRALNNFKLNDNKALTFLMEEDFEVGSQRISLQDLYDQFLEWCKSSGINHKYTKQTFGKKLEGAKFNGKEIEKRNRGGKFTTTTLNISKRSY